MSQCHTWGAMKRGKDDGEENVVVRGHANDGDTDLVKRMRSVSLRKGCFAERDFTGPRGSGGVLGDKRGASWRWQDAVVGTVRSPVSLEPLFVQFSALVFG